MDGKSDWKRMGQEKGLEKSGKGIREGWERKREEKSENGIGERWEGSGDWERVGKNRKWRTRKGRHLGQVKGSRKVRERWKGGRQMELVENRRGKGVGKGGRR